MSRHPCEVLQVTRGNDKTCDLEPKCRDVLCDLIFPVEMMNILPLTLGTFLDFRQSAPNVVLDAGLLGYLGHCLALLNFSHVLELVDSVLEVIGDGIEAIRPFQCLTERGLGIEIALLKHNVGSMCQQILRRRLLCI